MIYTKTVFSNVAIHFSGQTASLRRADPQLSAVEDLLEIKVDYDTDASDDHGDETTTAADGAPDDEAAVDRSEVMVRLDGDLEYEMVPGVRYGTRLLYVLAEKNLYWIKNSYPQFDRYICTAPKCRCAVRISKPEGVVRRTNLTTEHNHPHMESKYLECRLKHSLKTACLSSKGMVSPRQLLTDLQKR